MLLKIYSTLFFLLLFVAGTSANGQELFCRVNINADNAGVTDKSVFVQMQQQMQDFMNLRRRTNDQFAQDERIICNLNLTIKSAQGAAYAATAQITALRPVYGTSLETVLINYIDPDFNFEYSPGQPMEFNEQSPAYTDNLTSLLSFYGFIILGLDYDSFKKLGGKTNFLLAQQVAANAQSSAYKGWKPYEGTNNRNWLIENYMSQQLIPFREGCYNYYRLGLDKFETDPEGARVQTLDLINRMKTVLQVKPLCIAINSFLDAKSVEITNMLVKAPQADKQQAYNILVQIDPTKTDRYQKLLK